MFDLFDKFLDYLTDVYICNFIGIFSIIAIIILSIVEGIIVNHYFKNRQNFEDIKIYSLLSFRLMVFASTICFKFLLAFILSFLAIYISRKIEKRLYELKIDNMNFSDLITNFDYQKIDMRLYIDIGLVYFCIGLVFNSIFHKDISWLM